MRVGRRVGAAAMALVVGGCSFVDWESFSRGSAVGPDDAGRGDTGVSDSAASDATSSGNGDGDGGRDGGMALDAEAGAVVFEPAVSGDLVGEDDAIFRLTDLGSIDWLEMHQKNSPGNRCAPCVPAIAPVEATTEIFPFGDDGRRFRWSNGTPVENGEMSAGVYIDGIDQAFSFTIAPNGTRELLTLHINTYFAGATITAKLEGTSVTPAVIPVPAKDEVEKYAVRIRFVGLATTKLVVEYRLANELPIGGDEKPNIAFSAATLADE